MIKWISMKCLGCHEHVVIPLEDGKDFDCIYCSKKFRTKLEDGMIDIVEQENNNVQ